VAFFDAQSRRYSAPVVHASIRPARAADAQAIAEVHVATWRAAYRGLLPQALLDGLSVQQRASSWRSILLAANDQTLVAIDGPTEQIIGFVTVGVSRDNDTSDTVAELRAIYLHPSHWDTGLGRRLHDAGLDLLSEPFTEVSLWVLDSNSRARRFYERLGWHPDGGAKEDVRDDVTLSEVRYRRSLTEGA
jgi:RimJ/RimL family protein N-acetyltransferase